MMALTIVHTSDLHDRLDRKRAEALGFVREQAGALLLDSGDAIGAGNVYVRRAEPVLDLMNLAGYSAMVIGNREFYFRKRGLLHKTAAARFPVLSANIRPLTGDLGHIVPWKVLEAAGEHVGVFGLSREMVRPGHWMEGLSDVRFVPWRDAVAEAIAQLRERVDWLIALSHMGTRRERLLAEEFGDVDLILGGHGHDELQERVGPNQTLISHPGHYGRRAAILRLEREADGRAHITRKLIELG